MDCQAISICYELLGNRAARMIAAYALASFYPLAPALGKPAATRFWLKRERLLPPRPSRKGIAAYVQKSSARLSGK
jgi:hypothetical protein